MKNLLSILALCLVVIAPLSSDGQSRLQNILKTGTLKVGMTGDQPPFNMESKFGSMIGYEVDLAEILAESMNVELEIVKKPFNQLLPSLLKGEVDMVMSGMTITMERNARVAFVGPYLLSGKSIVTKMAILQAADNLEDLNMSNLKISSLQGSTSEKLVVERIPEATSLPAPNYEQATQMLLNGEANVFMADYPRCVMMLLQNPDIDLVTLSEPLTVEPIGIALPPDDPLMINFIENYFSALYMTGTLTELEAFWFENSSWLTELE